VFTVIVVADSSPINYLVLIDAVDILKSLFGEVIAPRSVSHELSSKGAPELSVSG
jgi:predicted nucleic acid-binding protein